MTTWALHTEVDLDAANLHLAALEEAGLLGIVERDGRATVYLPVPADVPLSGEWEQIPERDWNTAWKAGIEPVVVGRVTIVPPWLSAPVGGEVVLVVEPAQAFGTGHHETTTGCLAALQGLDLVGRSVLDVGTGTGVLALAAARLGAANVVSVDNDPLAVEAATGNARQNAADVDVRLGSVDAAGDERFDVVVANLDTATLCTLAAELAVRLASDGTLIASGVGNERVGEVVEALEGVSLSPAVQQGREWAVLVARAPRR